jgi:malate/lactate dehydrogenase
VKKRIAYDVVVVGAGNVGATLAQRLVDKELGDVVLVDILEGIPQGKALDMFESTPIEGSDCHVIGTNDYKDTANSDIVVITAGVARKPGMSRDDLLNINMNIVGDCTRGAVAHSPNSILIIVSNPLDAMCHVALRHSGSQRTRVRHGRHTGYRTLPVPHRPGAQPPRGRHRGSAPDAALGSSGASHGSQIARKQR